MTQAHFPLDRFTLHQHMPRNLRGRDWFVGDIHGYRDKLLDRLEREGFDFGADRLFAVGDLIDRGPDSLGTARLFLDEPWAYSTLGNHEWILIRALERDPKMAALAPSPGCGGQWQGRYPIGVLQALAEEFCNHLPITLTVDTPAGQIGVVHAHPPADWSQVQQWPPSAEVLDSWTHWIWSREGARQVEQGLPLVTSGIDAVICGHTTLSQAMGRGNVLFADTHVSSSGEGEFTLLTAEALLAQVGVFQALC